MFPGFSTEKRCCYFQTFKELLALFWLPFFQMECKGNCFISFSQNICCYFLFSLAFLAFRFFKELPVFFKRSAKITELTITDKIFFQKCLYALRKTNDTKDLKGYKFLFLIFFQTFKVGKWFFIASHFADRFCPKNIFYLIPGLNLVN